MAVWRRERGNGIAPAAVACAAGLLAALLATTGCSGTGAAAEGDAREVIRRAADRLAESGSSRARTAMQMASGGTRITLRGLGGFDYGERTGELRVTLPEGKPVTEVFVPGRLYMKNRGAGVPADKWLRIDITTLPDGNLVTGGATDPITAAELLRGVVTASDLGEAEVNGETLRHFRGVTDIGDAAAAASEQSRDQLLAAVDGFTRTEVPFDAYLDDQGLLRKVRHEFSFANDEAEGIDVASTVVLFDFGAPVEVRLPSAGEVYAGAVA
ncbi:hypothetical protein [Streptomyces litchfieldiae]|uniref:Lipoprotein n=1 Tax=Streptomyces litchfieldiae TaxID=3075543 RepID=A0ABU2MS18_9ACTN|nr:hypothetical protein [Streptomyces sp. DSM 44938]MDT0343404.1 hypothetical protein [Streptomyces sp. DSM 44938]